MANARVMPGTRMLLAMFLLFTLIGLGSFGWMSFEVFVANKFLSQAERTFGTVIRFEEKEDHDGTPDYYPVISFQANSGEAYSYTATIGMNPPSYKIGERVRVLYPTIDPSGAKLDSIGEIWGMVILSGIMGIAFLPAGLVYPIVLYRRGRFKRWLVKHGVEVRGKIVGVQFDTCTRMNKRNPYVLVCEAADVSTGATRKYFSDHYWTDPLTLGIRIGDEVKVLVHPKAPNRYWVSSH